MKKILITGDKGFIGTKLGPYLAALGHTVFCLSDYLSDVRDLARSSRALAAVEVDHVIHLAAKVGVKRSWEDPREYYAVNVDGTQQILDFCHHRDSSLTYLSAFAYDPAGQDPFTEECGIKPSSPYSHSKWLGEELCRFYQEKFDLQCTILRPFNLFGPGQKLEFLIPEIVRQAEASGDWIELRGITPVRDYLFIEDLMSLIERVVEDTTSGMIFNAGTGIGHSVEEVVQVIQWIWGTNKGVKDNGSERLFEVDSAIADITRVRTTLGWEPKYTLAEGLRMMHESSGPNSPTR